MRAALDPCRGVSRRERSAGDCPDEFRELDAVGDTPVVYHNGTLERPQSK